MERTACVNNDEYIADWAVKKDTLLVDTSAIAVYAIAKVPMTQARLKSCGLSIVGNTPLAGAIGTPAAARS